MEAQKQAHAEATPAKRPRKARKWPWVLVGILILLLVIVLLAPVVLSSRSFTRWVQARISAGTGGEASIQDLSVGWFRGIQVAGFRFRGENGWTEVDIDRITATPHYAGLLTGTLALDRAVLDQPRVAIDLRERPPREEPPVDMNNLERLRDVVVRDGSVQLTDTTGNTVQIADLNSNLSIRPPGRTSRFDAAMVVLAAAQPPGRVGIVAEATPRRETGWSLRGTTGDVTVEVNDLNLASVAPFLDLVGIQVQAQGAVSGSITSAIDNGRIRNLNATISGQGIEIGGEALQGDELQTAQLEVRASLTQTGNVIDVDQLEVRTDWANLSATGRLPRTPASLSQLLESGAAYDARGNFDLDLAALLSQMPNTLGVRPGMEITGGRATGTINTVTEAGRATLVAKAQVAGLAGVVNNEPVSLSEPVQATMRLTSDPEGAQLENLTVTAPFATINASGNFQQIRYQGRADLAALQAQLGPFINIGAYELAGQVTTQGQVSIGEQATDIAGTLSARQLVLTSADGNSVSEPQANVDYALSMVEIRQVLAVDSLAVKAGFGTLTVEDATIPLGADSPAALNAVVVARNVDLSRLQPYAEFFDALPEGLTIGGIAQSQVTVAKERNLYRFSSDATRIRDFRLVSRGEPFQQPEVTAFFDVAVDPKQKILHDAIWQVKSPQITFKGRFTQTSQASAVKAQGALQGEMDWAAVAPLVSGLVPGSLSITGQRQVALNFTSTYPANEPNGLLANLNGQASLGFDRAAYLGLDFGPTEFDIRVEDGRMTIGPIAATVNNGKLHFTGRADLDRTPALLTVPETLQLVQAVQINEQTAQTLLKYVNPIFADAVRVSGIANLEVQKMAIPLGENIRQRAELTGTIWIDQLQLGTSSILNQILAVVGRSISGQILTVRPTVLTLQNGVLRYDDMQIEIGDNPVNFRGSIGLDGALNLTVVLPYTLQGRLVRVGEAQPGERITVPLTGTITQPQLNLQKLVETQLKQRLEEQILKGLEGLFKRR